MGMRVGPARGRLVIVAVGVALAGGAGVAWFVRLALEGGRVTPWFWAGAIGLLTVAVVAAALVAAARARGAIYLTPAGIDIAGEYGRFCIAWENLEAVGRCHGRLVGLRVRDRDALLLTHQGSAQQREWLATLPRSEEWDLLLTSVDLACGIDRFVAWVAHYRDHPEARAELAPPR